MWTSIDGIQKCTSNPVSSIKLNAGDTRLIPQIHQTMKHPSHLGPIEHITNNIMDVMDVQKLDVHIYYKVVKIVGHTRWRFEDPIPF